MASCREEISMDQPFVEVDHSGDIGIEAKGKDLAALIKNLTRGLFSLMYRGGVCAEIERRICVESNSAEELIIDWLSEVLAVSDIHGELYESVQIEKAGDYYIEGILEGEKLDPKKHDLRFHVKAATYHGLRIKKHGGVLRARVIFDL